jgi:hypothetical protein
MARKSTNATRFGAGEEGAEDEEGDEDEEEREGVMQKVLSVKSRRLRLGRKKTPVYLASTGRAYS